MTNSPDENLPQKLDEDEVSPYAHYLRLVMVLIFCGACFFVIRSQVVPDSFGVEGHYRLAAVDEIVSREPRFKGNNTCTECHKDEVEEVLENAHKGVACETCHGPAKGHLTTAKDRVRLLVNKKVDGCMQCHRNIVGRPGKFPTIDLKAHAKEQEFKKGALCGECHEAHNPD